MKLEVGMYVRTKQGKIEEKDNKWNNIYLNVLFVIVNIQYLDQKVIWENKITKRNYIVTSVAEKETF